MPSITVKNIPREVHERLKAQAARHHRSVNQEIIDCLDRSTRGLPMAPEAFLAEARALRRQVRGRPITDADLQPLRSAGRK